MKQYLAQQKRLGLTPKRLAGLSGKVVERAERYTNEDGQQCVFMQFTDRTALNMEVKPGSVAVEWLENRNGDFFPLRKKVFETS